MDKKPQIAGFIRKEARKTICIRLPWLLTIPFGFLLPKVFGSYPYVIESIYTARIYPVLHAVLRVLFGSLFPFSIAEFIVYTLLCIVPLSLIIRAIRVYLGCTDWVRFLHLCMSWLITFGLVLNLFYILWGINYARPPISALLNLPVAERSVEELETLCISLSTTAASLRNELKEDEHGVFQITGGIPASFKLIPDAYQSLGQAIPLFRMRAAQPKYVFNSEAMSWAGIAGIYIPYTGEANVNIHQPHLLLPSSAAHESAHSLGFARENEANFVSYLACMHSSEPSIRYSGVMLALVHSGNQLSSADRDAYTRLSESYTEGMRRDIDAHNAYWRSYEGPVEEAIDRVNDNYLKHNQQESGVRSYGEMVDLLLAWQAAGNPV